jgi:hypothetical protein
MVFSLLVRYVSAETHRKAREMERLFAALPPQAGVLFVSIRPDPTEDGKGESFFLRLGIARRFEEETGLALVKKVLQEELRQGLRIRVGVHRGISGACRDDGTSTTYTLTA